MRINNKLLISIILLAFILLMIGLFGLISNNRHLDILISAGGGLLILTGTYLLVKNGQFIHSKEYQLSRIGFSFILLGIILKIMHWKYSVIILGLGCLSFAILYSIYVIRNIKIANWTNWLKLIFLVLFFLGRYFQWMHLNYSDELSIGALIAMIILVAEYILKGRMITIKK